MVDEATDAANDEQLAVSIPYVKSSTSCIQDRFMAYSEGLTGVTGYAIAVHILRLLDDWQLSSSYVNGQMYDGAGAMARKSGGAAARIQEAFPKAMYTVLRMALTCVWSIAEIRNMMDTAESIFRFFSNSPKRHLLLRGG